MDYILSYVATILKTGTGKTSIKLYEDSIIM